MSLTQLQHVDRVRRGAQNGVGGCVLCPKRLPLAYACMVLRPSNGALGSTQFNVKCSTEKKLSNGDLKGTQIPLDFFDMHPPPLMKESLGYRSHLAKKKVCLIGFSGC